MTFQTDTSDTLRHLENAGRDAKLQHIEVAKAGQTAIVTTYRMEELDADLQTLQNHS